MLKISQIKVPVEKQLTAEAVARKLHCPLQDIRSFTIDRKSLDARHHGPLHYSYTVYADVANEVLYLKNADVKQEEKQCYSMPEKVRVSNRPIVVGFGPAGMFASLILAECGARPIIIERGRDVDARTRDVSLFFKKGILQEESNVQFGEGGAGTFSDGKLTSRGKNIRMQKVMEEFIEAGADPSIMYDHRPHIGTDVLRSVVKKIREKILACGGEIHFETRMESLLLADGKAVGVHTNKGDYESRYIVLCAGHSASDTYEELLKQGIHIVQKDFAAGVRVEHPQVLIDQNTYGQYAGSPYLSAASYQLTARTDTGRGVYSFCMCPGGMVIPASTKEGSLAVNGMSYSARDGQNANSAILVQIPRSDFDKGHPMDGFAFQKKLEQRAFRKGFAAPCANIEDYIKHQVSGETVIKSSYPLSTHMEDMHTLFSDEVNASMEQAFIRFDHSIPGFIKQGIMLGMESRSSSPVRIIRNEDGQAETCDGLYPCGEGAGYAGGIVSSGVDGIRQAENVLKKMKNDYNAFSVQ